MAIVQWPFSDYSKPETHLLSLHDLHNSVTELVDQACARVLAWAETLCLSQGGSFSNQIWNNETDAKTGTAQDLFNG